MTKRPVLPSTGSVYLRRFSCAFAILLACATLHAQEEETTPIPEGARYIEREFHIQVPGSAPEGIDVLEVYINTPGKHPLALLTHGTSNDPEVREHVTPWGYLSQALWFARRGYVSLAIVRRGYGRSGGELDGKISGCSANGSFEVSGEASAEDLRNAVLYAEKSLPEVDTTHIVSAGVSTGGFAQVALTANPPPGLQLAISFAGGRGGDGQGDICNINKLIAAFHNFGTRSRTPMLWIYAQNDKWFPPADARKFEAAFERGGGHDRFILAPPNGEDGHGLFADVPAWSNTVESFLRERHLLPLTIPYAQPPVPNVPVPEGLQKAAIDAFHQFLIKAPYKAFATNGHGSWGDATAQFSQAIADQKAMENCNKFKHEGTTCEIASRGK